MRYLSCLPQKLPPAPSPEHSALLPVHPGASCSLLPLPAPEPPCRPQTELPAQHAQLRPWTQGMLHSRHPYRQPACCFLPCRPASHHFALRSPLHHTALRCRLRSARHHCTDLSHLPTCQMRRTGLRRLQTCRLRLFRRHTVPRCIRRSLHWRTAPGSCHSPPQPDVRPLLRQSSPLFSPAQSLPPLFSDFLSADSNVRPPPSGFRTVHSIFFPECGQARGSVHARLPYPALPAPAFPHPGTKYSLI